MAYIDGEVRAVCEAKGWGHQIRRKWSIREKPVSNSAIQDYEWKLIPDPKGKPHDGPLDDSRGVYYVLCFDEAKDRFVLQHDTAHCGTAGPHWEVETYTEILLQPSMTPVDRGERGALRGHPPVGWLRDHLRRLTSSFGPNHFSDT